MVTERKIFRKLTFAHRSIVPGGVAICYDCKDEIGIGYQYVLTTRKEENAGRVNDTKVRVCAGCYVDRIQKKVDTLRSRLHMEETFLRELLKEAHAG